MINHTNLCKLLDYTTSDKEIDVDILIDTYINKSIGLNRFIYYSKISWKQYFDRPHQIMRFFDNTWMKVFITSDDYLNYDQKHNLLIIPYCLKDKLFKTLQTTYIYYTDPLLYDEIMLLKDCKILFDLTKPPINDYSSWMSKMNSVIRHADYIIYSHPNLVRFIKDLDPSKDYHYIPNGCDYEHFSKAKTQFGIRPNDIPVNNKCVLGYYGYDDLDYDIIKKYADENKYNIIMIGETLKRFEYKNITWLGYKTYDEIATYLSWFDKCFLPLKDTKYVNPYQLMEYMASGKEIITNITNINIYNIKLYSDISNKIKYLLTEYIKIKEYNKILTYVINFNDDIEKFNLTHENLKNSDLNLEIKRFTVICNDNVHNQNKRFIMHLDLIKYFYHNSDDDFMLVCEDNIEIIKHYNLNLYQIIDNCPTDWEKIGFTIFGDDKIFEYNFDYINSYDLNKADRLFACYIINKKGAKKIINQDKLQIDPWLFDIGVNYIYKYPFFSYRSQEFKLFDPINYNGQIKTILNISNPEISIILPTYNGMKYLEESITSILNQTFKNFELIIIVDGSTDKTIEYLNTLKDNRIHIHYQENKKLPNALNEGIIRCRGNYITWTSDDNIMLPDCIEKLYNCLKENTDCDFCYGGVEHFGDKNWYKNKYINNYEIFFAYPGLYAFMWTKKIIKKIGYYNIKLNKIEDYDYILRTLEINPKTCRVDFIIYKYRHLVNENNLTSEIIKNNETKRLNELLINEVLKRNAGLPNLDFFMQNNDNDCRIINKNIYSYLNKCGRDGYREYFRKYREIYK